MIGCVCFCRPAVLCALAGSAVVAAASPAGASGSFLPLGVLDGSTQYPQSFGVGMTPDGQTVVGFSNRTIVDNVGTELSYASGFRWTASDGLMFGLPAPLQELGATAASRISADGSVIVGSSGFSLKGNYEARNGAFWTDAAGPTPIARHVEEVWTCNDVSRDGQVIVGTTRVAGVPFPIPNSAFMWDWQNDDIIELGTLPGGSYSLGNSVSGDGSVVVGSGDSSAGFIQAWRWTESSGMEAISGLASDQPSEAFDVSADGVTIVGATGQDLFRWTPTGGAEVLGHLPGASFVSGPMDVSADGQAIVGSFLTDEGAFVPFLWTPESGLLALDAYLAGVGVDMMGYTPVFASAISDDGTRIAGVAISPSGIPEAYLITIPSPGAGVLALGALAAGRRRRR